MTRVLLLLCTAIVLFHWRLVFSDEYTWLEAPGIFERVLPLLQFQAGELHKWRLPIFDPYSPGGQPLIGFSGTAGVVPVWYLPHTLLLALPLNHGWLFQKPLHWYLVLTQCAMAAAMCLFARRRLSLSPSAAFVAGLAYALGVLSATGPDPQTLQSAIWLPAIFAARPGWRRGLFLGLIWLPGGLYLPLAATLALAVSDFRHARRDLAMGLAIGAIAILPGFAFVGPLPPLPLANLSAGVVLPVLGIFGWYLAMRRPQARAILLPTAVAGLIHPALLIFSLAAALGLTLDDSGAIRPVARRWAILAAAVAAAVLCWNLLPWIRFDQLQPIEAVALPCLLAGAAALLLWSRPEPRRAIVFAALLVLADNARPQTSQRWFSRHDDTRPRKLASLAQAAPQVTYLRQFANDLPRVWVDPAEIPYAFGPWWGVETTATAAQATHRLSARPTPGFDRVLYSGDDGFKVYAASGREPQACLATKKAEFLSPNVRRFATVATCPSTFHAGLASSQGWRVTLDGKSVEYPQQGLPVPAGDHQVELRFLPISLIVGALVTGIGLAYTVWLARRRSLKR
ncbi:MAG: hypothetical protein JST65_12795 [Acidobacteria bacterium]|nr:hypothetical protein [Acidobacteriota bacterium]